MCQAAIHHTLPFTLLKDPEGRYIILIDLLQDVETTIASYYAPNSNPNPFLSHLFQVIHTHCKGTLLLCGNSNLVLQPHLDKSPYTPEQYSPSIRFQKLLQQASLLDTWRKCNASKKNYTFYSYPHKLFSRIDHIFVSVASSLILLGSIIQPITWSDHCAVITTISSLMPQSRDRTWCINEVHLANQSYCLDIEIALKDYLLHNSKPGISLVLLWVAHKPVIRGTCISVSTHLKHDKKLKLAQLEAEFHQCFLQFQFSPTETHRLASEKAKAELDLLLAESANKDQVGFIHDDKPAIILEGLFYSNI